MRVTWLADVLHAAGLPLCPVDGWQGRGRELTTINGIVAHHTATPASTPDGSVAKLLRDGRPDLAGPLAQLGLDRQGRYWLIADGKCNHNGHGMWGNQALGIEAFNNGKGEPWSALQLGAYVKGCAAILRHLGQNEGHVQAHRETDPLRKVDPVGIDMNEFRRKVAALLHSSPHPSEDDVFEYRIVTIPAVNDKGFQFQGHDVNNVELGLFHEDVNVTIKANDNGAPVKAIVQPYAYNGKLALSFIGLDGEPAPQGNVGIVLSHPPR